jgi:hypothetical protein
MEANLEQCLDNIKKQLNNISIHYVDQTSFNCLAVKVDAIAASLEQIKTHLEPVKVQATMRDYGASLKVSCPSVFPHKPAEREILGRETFGGAQLEECSTCKFFQYNAGDAVGRCRYNPERVVRRLGDWCGQYKRGHHE